jgi:hypothetical protein
MPKRKMLKPRTITIVVVAFLAISFFSSLSNLSETTQVPTSSTTTEATPTRTATPEPEPTASETPTTDPSDTAATTSPSQTPSPAATVTNAASANDPDTQDQEASNLYQELLLSLSIKAEVTSGYDRDLFRHWVDADSDGCDARKEVLIQESLTQVGLGDRCRVEVGTWLSLYDNQQITDSSKLDIDHMIPLKEAWDSGADQWPAARRQAFANDLDLPQALIAVSAGSNRSKSAGDPADWLPTNQSYICQYIQDWMIVKVKWELSVDQREFNTLSNVATRCVN